MHATEKQMTIVKDRLGLGVAGQWRYIDRALAITYLSHLGWDVQTLSAQLNEELRVVNSDTTGFELKTPTEQSESDNKLLNLAKKQELPDVTNLIEGAIAKRQNDLSKLKAIGLEIN